MTDGKKKPKGQEITQSVCEKLITCHFVHKLSQTDKFRMRMYQNNYCEGPHMTECARLRFLAKNHTEPPENLAPTGIDITDYLVYRTNTEPPEAIATPAEYRKS